MRGFIRARVRMLRWVCILDTDTKKRGKGKKESSDLGLVFQFFNHHGLFHPYIVVTVTEGTEDL